MMSLMPMGVQPPAARHAVEGARLRKRAAAIDERPSAHRFVARGDALEARRRQRFRRGIARLDAPRGLRGRELVQGSGHGRQHSRFLAPPGVR
jgi:hypothetical protein